MSGSSHSDHIIELPMLGADPETVSVGKVMCLWWFNLILVLLLLIFVKKPYKENSVSILIAMVYLLNTFRYRFGNTGSIM